MKQEENEFMRHELRLPELTVRGMLLGALLTVIFTASNVYLGLKVGLTFSSAIPAAVISMAVLKMAKNSNILENNMVQTQASAAGTLSAIIFIIPGMLMIGYWQGFEFWQTLLVSACGGCLGVLFTIPLRRAMVVHSDLAYPEGVAAAEILKVECPAGVRRGALALDTGRPLHDAAAARLLNGTRRRWLPHRHCGGPLDARRHPYCLGRLCAVLHDHRGASRRHDDAEVCGHGLPGARPPHRCRRHGRRGRLDAHHAREAGRRRCQGVAGCHACAGLG